MAAAIIIGVIGALLGVYFKELIATARLRLSVAVSLESQLRFLIQLGLQDEILTNLLVAGLTLGEQEKEALKSNDFEKLKILRKSIEEKTKKGKEDFLKDQPEVIQKIIKDTKKFSKMEFEELISRITKTEDSLNDLNGLLGQDKIVVMDWEIIPQVIEIKSEIRSLLFNIKFCIIHIYTNKEVDNEKVVNFISSCVINAIKASKNIVPLINYSSSIREKGLLGNIFPKRINHAKIK